MTGATTTTTATRAVAYLRVSTDEQADSGAGLDAQMAAIEAAATARGWDLVAVHTDAGVSGGIAPTSRPALCDALAMLDGGNADVLVVAKSDRLARSVVGLVELLDRADRADWSLVVLDSDVDTSTAAGRLVASMIGCVAEWERRVISERTRAALATRKASGMRLGSPVTLEQATRDRIASLWADGLTLQAIANTLTAEMIPTARGGRWYPSTVAAVLRSLDLDAEAAQARTEAVTSRRRMVAA
jgi:DNA invertase Pin-like site-specific DNA recombinase